MEEWSGEAARGVMNKASESIHPVIIVGGGAAGVWMAVWLAHGGLKDIIIVEPRADLGRGLAYSASDARHLLNVTVSKMDSHLVPGIEGFGAWLAGRGLEAPEGYHPRSHFGDYMEHVVARLRGRCDLDHRRHKAIELSRKADSFVVGLDDGSSIRARHVVVAVGNLKPRRLALGLPHARIVEDPWNLTRESIGTARDALVAGTGLTAIDAVISLIAANPDMRITLAANRPFTPPPDIGTDSWPGADALKSAPPSALWREVVRELRRQPDDAAWIRVIEGVKGQAQRLWQGWTTAQRASFIRHGLRHWLHHRHRAPPPAHRLMQRLLDSGQATLRQGRVSDIWIAGDRIDAVIGDQRLSADLVVNATGPSVIPHDDAFLASALVQDLLRPDPLGLGLAVGPTGAALGSTGQAIPGLWVLGAWTRGTFFEVVPVPVIRRQAGNLATRILAALDGAGGNA
jgi:uncharacterized NAD(P)/FAD-binding protein YdhS